MLHSIHHHHSRSHFDLETRSPASHKGENAVLDFSPTDSVGETSTARRSSIFAYRFCRRKFCAAARPCEFEFFECILHPTMFDGQTVECTCIQRRASEDGARESKFLGFLLTKQHALTFSSGTFHHYPGAQQLHTFSSCFDALAMSIIRVVVGIKFSHRRHQTFRCFKASSWLGPAGDTHRHQPTQEHAGSNRSTMMRSASNFTFCLKRRSSLASFACFTC